MNAGAKSSLLPVTGWIDTATPAAPSTHLTGTGLLQLRKAPSPIFPFPPKPQQYGWLKLPRPQTSPAPRTIAVKVMPPVTRTGADALTNGSTPSPRRPFPDEPQQYPAPPTVTPHVPYTETLGCEPAALIAVNSSPPATNVGARREAKAPSPSCPASLLVFLPTGSSGLH